MSKTSIEWTATRQPDGTVKPGYTFNGWWGCTHVHEGCRNCYAEKWALRFGVSWGSLGPRTCGSEKVWAQPLKWNAAAEREGVRAKVFCQSMSDVFEDWTGQVTKTRKIAKATYVLDEGWITSDGQFRFHSSPADKGILESQGMRPLRLEDLRSRLFKLIDSTPWLDWQLLTKRPENIRRMTPPYAFHACETGDCPHNLQSECATSDERKFRDNAWLGTSVSDQASYDKQFPHLEACRDLSPVLFLSAEPLLGPIDFDFACARRELSCIDWVIVGGESTRHARPMHPAWVLSARDQCQAADVPFFFKQWGEWAPLDHEDRFGVFGSPDMVKNKVWDDRSVSLKVGKKSAGRQLDWRTWDEFPIVESGVA